MPRGRNGTLGPAGGTGGKQRNKAILAWGNKEYLTGGESSFYEGEQSGADTRRTDMSVLSTKSRLMDPHLYAKELHYSRLHGAGLE